MEKRTILDRLANGLACRMADVQGGGAAYQAIYEYYALGRLQRVLAYGSMLGLATACGLFAQGLVLLLCVHYLKG